MATQHQTRSMIEFAVEEPDGTMVIRLGDDVDPRRASELCECIAALGTTGTEIIFDLTDVQAFDGACLNVLGEAWAEARRNGHRVALRSCPGPDVADDLPRGRVLRRRGDGKARRGAHASRVGSRTVAPGGTAVSGRPHLSRGLRRRRRAHARRRYLSLLGHPFLVAVLVLAAASVAWFAR